MDLSNKLEVTRVFPLAKMLLLPRVVKEFNVFEARYLEMVKDSLADNSEICIAIIKKGYEADYLNNPPIYDTACIGKIEKHIQNTDGTYFITVKGIKQVVLLNKVEEESKPYRLFTFKEQAFSFQINKNAYMAISVELHHFFEKILSLQLADEYRSLFESIRSMNIKKQINELCFAFPLEIEHQIMLMKTPDLLSRAHLLLTLIEEMYKELRVEENYSLN